MNNAAGETAGVTQDVGSDPTVRNVSLSTQASARPSTDANLAVCLRCGVTLLHCNLCEDPASVDEYNHFVAHHPDFAMTRTMGYIHSATFWNAQDEQGRSAWTDKFAACGELNISNLAQESLASFLPSNNSLMPLDADPPEALEEPPEYDDVSMYFGELNDVTPQPSNKTLATEHT